VQVNGRMAHNLETRSDTKAQAVLGGCKQKLLIIRQDQQSQAVPL